MQSYQRKHIRNRVSSKTTICTFVVTTVPPDGSTPLGTMLSANKGLSQIGRSPCINGTAIYVKLRLTCAAGTWITNNYGVPHGERMISTLLHVRNRFDCYIHLRCMPLEWRVLITSADKGLVQLLENIPVLDWKGDSLGIMINVECGKFQMTVSKNRERKVWPIWN